VRMHPFQLGEVTDVDDPVLSTGDQEDGQIDRSEPGSGLGGKDHLVEGLGVGGPGMVDGISGYFWRQVATHGAEHSCGGGGVALTGEMAGGFGQPAVDADESRHESDLAQPAATFGHGPVDGRPEADDRGDEVGAEQSQAQCDHGARAVAGHEGGPRQSGAQGTLSDRGGVVVRTVAPGRAGGGAEPEEVRNNDAVARRQPSRDGTPETVGAGQAVEEDDGRTSADHRDGQRRPLGDWGSRGARRPAFTGDHAGGTGRGQELLAEIGHETWIGPAGCRRAVGGRDGHGCLTPRYGRGYRRPSRRNPLAYP